MREKFSESNALAALSRALKAQREEPAAPNQEAPTDHTDLEKRKRKKDTAVEQTPLVVPSEQPKAASSGGDRTSKKSKKEKDKREEEKEKKGKKGKERAGRGSTGREGVGPSTGAAQELQATPDPLRLCTELVSLASSLEASRGEALLQELEQRASQLVALYEGRGPGGAPEELQALQEGLQGLRESLQGNTTLPETYSRLQRSAAALQLATAAAQLAQSAAQHSAAGLAQGPSQGGSSRASAQQGRVHAGGGGPPVATAGSFQRWYISSFADSFSKELEALQESEAAPVAAVLRNCIAVQAGLFSPAYQRLALSGAYGS